MTIIEKPWGKEEVIEINENYMLKKLTMYKNNRCSLQYHNKKKETIYVLEGKLLIYIGNEENSLEEKIFTKNQTITISPKIIHRMEALEDSIYLESSTPEMDDVIRIKDDYSRK